MPPRATTTSHASMRRVFRIRRDALAGLVFALLVLAVFGQIWFASTPLPFGGPNIGAAVAAALLAVVLWVWQSAPLARSAGVGHAMAVGLQRFRPALPALVVALAMWVWVFSTYLRTGTFDPMRMGQLTAGIGTLFALLCVLSARRGRRLIAAIVIATALSALFGIGVLVVGQRFVDVWLHIANVAEKDLETIIIFGRTAGAAVHPGTLGYQLAVALVLGFAILVLGPPTRHGRLTRLADVAVFVLVTSMLVSLAVNATRSTILGVAMGVVLCVVGATTAPAPRRGVVRLLVVGPALALALFALFNPWFNLGSLFEAARPVRPNVGDIADLVAGDRALSSNDPQVLGHRFDGYKPGVTYEVRLRTIHLEGFGWRSEVHATADANGGFVLTWRHDTKFAVTGYQFRVREAKASRFQSWRWFIPALRSRGATLAVRGLAVGSAGVSFEDKAVIGVEVAGFVPARTYDVQLRAMLPAEKGPSSQAAGAADGDGRLVFTWRRVVLPNVTYQFRARQSPHEQWPAWRDCAPTLPRPPVWSGLQVGTETLGAATPGDERIGHRFAGRRPWKWYRVQVREALIDGVERPARHGEISLRSGRRSFFVLTWPAPRAPEGVAYYQFRIREAMSDWFPWRDFTASLSSRTPVPSTVPVGWSVVLDSGMSRHTLLGLPPGENQELQLRLRTAHGFGRASRIVDGAASEDGSFVLAWREARAAQVTGVQFRQRLSARNLWEPWRNLQEPFDGGRTMVDARATGVRGSKAANVAHTAQSTGGGLHVQWRLFQVKDLSARSRLPQTKVALRYALDHPFGTGVYRPDRSHVGKDYPETMSEDILRLWPHNQFLHVLVLYGIPGLGLHLLFYAFLVRAAWRAAKLVWREPRADLRFLVVAVLAAWSAYSVNSLLLPTGPFLQDWGHYFVVGLLLSLEGIIAKERQ